MTRRKYRGQRLAGLFTFDQTGTPTTEPEDVGDNPLRRRCITCGSGIGERCTRPGRGGRKPMYQHFHEARQTTTSTEET
jgi:hypothetical protein